MRGLGLGEGGFGEEDETSDLSTEPRPPLVVVKHAGKARRRNSLPVVASNAALHIENLGIDLGRE